MIPESILARTWEIPTSTERRELIKQRILCLQDATAVNRAEGPLPVPWRVGWTCHISVLGRSEDGSLCAELIARGPGLRVPYVRSVRLVKRPR
jgi:hypothetical protein